MNYLTNDINVLEIAQANIEKNKNKKELIVTLNTPQETIAIEDDWINEAMLALFRYNPF